VRNLVGQVAVGTATVVTNAAPPVSYAATSEFSGCVVVV
jgi:hypothetical protein